MWNAPTESQLGQIPRLHTTEQVYALDKILHMHFFLGTSDWYPAEYCPYDRIFFGYSVLNGDLDRSEWSYFGYDEMLSVRIGLGIEIDRDVRWLAKPSRDVTQIFEAHRRRGNR